MRRAATLARGASVLLLTGTLTALPLAPLDAQETRAAVDVSVGGSYSTNPFLIRGGGAGAFATELAVTPQVTFLDERSEATILARYRRSDYLTRYSAAEGYGVAAQARRAMTPTLTARADLSFDSSIIGQNGLGVVGVVDSTVQPTPGTPDIAVIGLNQRQNAIVAGLGADWRVGPRDTLTAQGSVSRITYDGNSAALLSSRTTAATVGYSRALSERTSIGVQGSGSWINYDRPGYSGHTYSPQFTLNRQISQQIRFSLGAGVIFVSSTTPFGTSNVTGLSGTFNGCREAGRTTQCLRAFSDAQPTGLGDVSRRYGGTFDYSYRLRESDVVRATIDYSHLTATSNTTLQVPSVGFLGGSVSYERGFTRRLFAGASVGYRQATGDGFGNPNDVTFRLFLRTRLGDRR